MTLDEFLSSPDAPRAAALARRVGCSRSHMMHLRRGQKQPSLKLALRIERASFGEVPVESWEDTQEAA